MLSTIFVSYSHHDKPWVRDTLVPRLRSWGINVVIDSDFHVGASLARSIQRAIENAAHVVFVISRSFIASEWTTRELQETIAHDPAAIRRKAIPVVLDESAVPQEIRAIVWCNFSGTADAEDEWWRLCESVGGNWKPTISDTAEGKTILVAPERSADLEALRSVAISSRSPRQRTAAIHRVATLGGASELKWLSDIIWTSKYSASRRQAIAEIRKFEGPKSLAILKEIAEHHSRSDSRAAAVTEVIISEGVSNPGWLLRILKSEESWYVRLALADSLVDFLSNLPEDAMPLLSSQDIMALRKQSEHENHPDVRHHLISIVAHLGRNEIWAKSWIAKLAHFSKSYFYRVRCYAIGLSLWPQDEQFRDALKACVAEEQKQGKEFWDHTAGLFLKWADSGDWDRYYFHMGGWK